MSQSSKTRGGETQANFAHHVPSDTQEEPSQDWCGGYAFRSYSFFPKVKKLHWIADSVAGYGDVPIKCGVNGNYNHGILQNVLHIPKLGVNLFSIKSATSHGFKAVFTGCKVELSKNGEVRLAGLSQENNLYVLDIISCHELDDRAVEIDEPSSIFDLVANSCFEEIRQPDQKPQLNMPFEPNHIQDEENLPTESQEVSDSSTSHEEVDIQELTGASAVNQTQKPPLGRRVRRPPVRWIDESTNKFYAKLASVGVVEEPKNFKNAVESPQADHWKNAMEEEMDALVMITRYMPLSS
ncbi:hypothetical protein DAPPUDRAFT_327902 [Daphnia pulex]|uniref:Retrovirus-related Pol polyprotein from transposon TNT 1-94-like beta-barrel domain-containing protein n=1 Tax=Daphnia pulex TaxID=6669 RepID=E9HC45_DAPPU|nr:hypothetical protein DAPPUDRAFT_327902 [Daphnia pulex]|eukprot:EFX70723.1 hypothetical protein DAPPUDRAFT_327902 [Daphnia pulex]